MERSKPDFFSNQGIKSGMTVPLTAYLGGGRKGRVCGDVFEEIGIIYLH